MAALLALVASHLTYWFVTHPVNNFWTKDIELTGLGATFFSLFAPEAVAATGPSCATSGSIPTLRVRSVRC